MIPIKPASEPDAFDDVIRQPGLSAIAELVGEPPLIVRPGPRREPVAKSRDRIPSRRFPKFWTEALPDLRERYGSLCAYLALYIPPGTGTATVDHFVAKSSDWRLVYEWSNYRWHPC